MQAPWQGVVKFSCCCRASHGWLTIELYSTRGVTVSTDILPVKAIGAADVSFCRGVTRSNHCTARPRLPSCSTASYCGAIDSSICCDPCLLPPAGHI
jgi:hypothetical protein